eukprot:5299608-Prymnesium_polylepis.1
MLRKRAGSLSRTASNGSGTILRDWYCCAERQGRAKERWQCITQLRSEKRNGMAMAVPQHSGSLEALRQVVQLRLCEQLVGAAEDMQRRRQELHVAATVLVRLFEPAPPSFPSIQ